MTIRDQYKITNRVLLAVFLVIGIVIAIVALGCSSSSGYKSKIDQFDTGAKLYHGEQTSDYRSMWLWSGSELAQYFNGHLHEANHYEVMRRLEMIRSEVSWYGLDETDNGRWWRIDNAIYQEHVRQAQLAAVDAKHCEAISAAKSNPDRTISSSPVEVVCN